MADGGDVSAHPDGAANLAPGVEVPHGDGAVEPGRLGVVAPGDVGRLVVSEAQLGGTLLGG